MCIFALSKNHIYVRVKYLYFDSLIIKNRFHEERNRLEDGNICSKHKQVVSLQTK